MLLLLRRMTFTQTYYLDKTTPMVQVTGLHAVIAPHENYHSSVIFVLGCLKNIFITGFVAVYCRVGCSTWLRWMQ